MPAQFPFQKELEPKKRQITFPEGDLPWGALNKYDTYSRWTIHDTEMDDLINFIPMGMSLRQTPAAGSSIATLTATVVWMSAEVLNSGVYLFCLCSDNSVYQVSTGGAITKINGATSIGLTADITNWQGSTILISDPVASKTYSWDGTTFATVTALNGIKGAFIEVFGGRLWLANGSTITFTDANTYNSVGGSAGSFVITDADCKTGIIGLKAFQGSLYVFGPNYIQVISGLYVSGSPPVLTFTRYTLTSQVGIINKWSLIPYGAYLYFANAYGIWQLQGGVPLLISGPIGGFFQSLLGGSSWSGGYVQVYGEPCLCWHGQYGGDSQHTVFCYTSNGQWWRAQVGTVAFIAGITASQITNNNPTLWGTDGTHIFQLFSNALGSVTSSFSTKLWSFGNPVIYKRLQKVGIVNLINSSATFTFNLQNAVGNTVNTVTQSFTPSTFVIQNNALETLQLQNNTPANLFLTGSSNAYAVWQFDAPLRDRALGINGSLVSSGASLMSVALEIEESQAGWGS
jgi:hypothetical protein